MKKLELGKSIQILANVGVIAGIAFLALELQQNTKQLELQSYQSWVNGNLQYNMTLTDPARSEIIAAGLPHSRNLDEENYVAFGMIQLTIMQMAQSTDYLYREGALDPELWKAEMSRAAGILSLPGVRQWWDAGGRTQVTSSFAKFIESYQPDITIWGWCKDLGFFRDDGLERSGEC